MVVAEQLLITRLVTAARNIFWASTYLSRRFWQAGETGGTGSAAGNLPRLCRIVSRSCDVFTNT